MIAFTRWKPIQNLRLPSDLTSRRQGELQELELGTANPFSNRYSTSFFHYLSLGWTNPIGPLFDWHRVSQNDVTCEE